VHAENYGHAKTLLRAYACGLRGKNTARAPCVCLAIWQISARRQHVDLQHVRRDVRQAYIQLATRSSQVFIKPAPVAYHRFCTQVNFMLHVLHC
jgi:hypothetical protein